MRTTLDIEDDVLAAAREIARREHKSAGKVVSQLLREALAGHRQPHQPDRQGVGGFRPFASRGTPVTNETIDRLRDLERT
jgi:hypothetical protein